MALSTIPGTIGFVAKRASSLDGRAVGKFTDSNHLSILRTQQPQEYDKKIISLYSQLSLVSNDFLQMLNKSQPFYIDTNSDFFSWKINSPYKFPTIIGIPVNLNPVSNIGIDSQPFYVILDTNEYHKNEVLTAHRMYAQEWMVLEDPTVADGGGWLYKLQILSTTPQTESVDTRFFKVGQELQLTNNLLGEFDTDLPGLGRLGEEIQLFESLSAGYGLKHSVTDWADARILRNTTLDGKGRPLDIVVYQEQRRAENGKIEVLGERWEPLVEQMLRKKMMEMKVARMIWSKGGTGRTGGTKQELKKNPVGVYHKIRNNGNLVQYNRGQFSLNILRDVFGDLFYRRVPMAQRRVKMYTNEAGILAFQQANLEDLRAAGFTIIPDQRFIQGSGRGMMISYAFDATYTTETGRIDVVHLLELDLPQTNAEFGQNKKSTPLFIVFDVSDASGGLSTNVREVRHRSRPSMTWGYVDGAIHHLGFAASQGMSSASMDPWYTIWFKDRADVFIEDPTRCVIIEEKPQF